MKVALFLSVLFLFSFHNESVVKLESKNFSNLYKINHELYRSEQPNQKGMVELQNLGIATLVNLRNVRKDDYKARNTSLNLIHYPINTWKIEYNDLVNVLKKIKVAKKPVLIHCLHGSDRTGAIVAVYRMAIENWPKEKAISEFKQSEFGYHEKWFPNILELLNSIDIVKLKNDIQ